MENTEIQKYIERRDADLLGIAIYEENLRFLTEDRPGFKSSAFRDNPFLKEVEDRLNNAGSFENFIRFFKFPHKGVSLSDQIWDENSKVFEAKDKKIIYSEDAESSDEVDFDVWRYWRDQAWQAYKFAPNAIGVIIEAPEEDATKYKAITVEAKNLIHREYVGENITKLVYRNGDHVYVYTEDAYIRVKVKDGKVIEREDMLVYYDEVPAFFISKRRVNTESATRTNVLSKYLAEISDFVQFNVLSKISKGFAYNNVIERLVPSNSCTYESPTTQCSQGYLQSKDGGAAVIDMTTKARVRCPQCNTLPTIGGTVDIPFKAVGDVSNPSSAINFVAPDTAALKFTGEDLAAWEHAIFSSATGKDKNTNSNKNFNSELSILYATEGQRDVLRKIKGDLIPGFVRSVEILGQLYFGANFKSALVDMGDDFILASKAELISLKGTTDGLGLSSALGIDEQLIQASSAGNPSEERRARVIVGLNYILGAEDATKAVARFELKKPIRSIARPVAEIITEIITEHEKLKGPKIEVQDPVGQSGEGDPRIDDRSSD